MHISITYYRPEPEPGGYHVLYFLCLCSASVLCPFLFSANGIFDCLVPKPCLEFNISRQLLLLVSGLLHQAFCRAFLKLRFRQRA
ncbi:hypothetical protein EV421DRAFT_1767185 [Armillaria borealis]|uniref:Uncharacterized protein n=1 Tax=Armillaria borealis TaxID=47425 RepID=A0AA39N0Y3_9AGAR|nr:hypothetical protein EV421DRAFT_1767185 [Armillaria borealis]